MFLVTFLIWRHNVKLDKKWKLIGHRQLPVSRSKPMVGESAQAIGVPRLSAQKVLTTANTQKGFLACRSCEGVQQEGNMDTDPRPARLLAYAFTAHRSLAHPKKSASVRLVQRGSKGTERFPSQCLWALQCHVRRHRQAVMRGLARSSNKHRCSPGKYRPQNI